MDSSEISFTDTSEDSTIELLSSFDENFQHLLYSFVIEYGNLKIRKLISSPGINFEVMEDFIDLSRAEGIIDLPEKKFNQFRDHYHEKLKSGFNYISHNRLPTVISTTTLKDKTVGIASVINEKWFIDFEDLIEKTYQALPLNVFEIHPVSQSTSGGYQVTSTAVYSDPELAADRAVSLLIWSRVRS